MKFSKELSEYRFECELNPLIGIGTCGLYIVHGAFKTGAELTSWDLKGVLNETYFEFSNYLVFRPAMSHVLNFLKFF